MEYKLRLGLQRKRAKIRQRLGSGFRRVTIRGRKRWVKPSGKAG